MSFFAALRSAIQRDPGNRGLARIPGRNLLTACPDDLELACRSIAQTPNACLAVVTGFYIPSAGLGETDGPLGAVFLARALFPLGIRVVLVTDGFCAPALETGVTICGLRKEVNVALLPSHADAVAMGPAAYRQSFAGQAPRVTHLVALERVGPSHTHQSLQKQLEAGGALGQTYLSFAEIVTDEHLDRCHTMRGIDITEKMSPAHWLFEPGPYPLRDPCSIGIGDGGNEIGMGKISWEVLRDNIPGGGLVACRVPTERLIVCGVSNWGAYALAAGLYHVLGKAPAPSVHDANIEQRILQTMVDKGPLVDGVSGQKTATVDGLPWDVYAGVLRGCFAAWAT